MNKFKKEDKILVTKGKDAGKEGKILKVMSDKQKLIVEKINIVKKHQKPTGENEPGGIKEIPAPISWANVMLISPSSGKPVKVGYKSIKGQKKRFDKKTGEVID